MAAETIDTRRQLEPPLHLPRHHTDHQHDWNFFSGYVQPMKRRASGAAKQATIFSTKYNAKTSTATHVQINPGSQNVSTEGGPA